MTKSEESVQNAIIFFYQQRKEQLKLKREITKLYVEFSKEKQILKDSQDKKEVVERIFKLAKTIKEKENTLKSLQTKKQKNKTQQTKTPSKTLHQNTQNQNERTN